MYLKSYPVHWDSLVNRAKLSVHGHLHSKKITRNNLTGICTDGIGTITYGVEDPTYFNVSVEQNNLTPIHGDIIMDRLKTL